MPLGDESLWGYNPPSGNVKGFTIPPNINLSKGLKSPWTVLRIYMIRSLVECPFYSDEVGKCLGSSRASYLSQG